MSVEGWNPEELDRQVMAMARKGVVAGCIFLKGRIRETVSEPAPRKRVLGKRGKLAGVLYYRATAPAIRGAPPRKLSGRYRSTIDYQVASNGLTGRIGSNAVQARRLEQDGHPHLQVTLDRARDELAQVMTRAMTR